MTYQFIGFLYNEIAINQSNLLPYYMQTLIWDLVILNLPQKVLYVCTCKNKRKLSNFEFWDAWGFCTNLKRVYVFRDSCSIKPSRSETTIKQSSKDILILNVLHRKPKKIPPNKNLQTSKHKAESEAKKIRPETSQVWRNWLQSSSDKVLTLNIFIKWGNKEDKYTAQ